MEMAEVVYLCLLQSYILGERLISSGESHRVERRSQRTGEYQAVVLVIGLQFHPTQQLLAQVGA